jgi:hypothetical protein
MRRLPATAAALMALLILGGALIWFRPFLERQTQPVAGVPAPAGLSVASGFALPSHGKACMTSVALEPNGKLAAFGLRPASASRGGGPPVDLLLSGAGYRAVLHVPGGYPGGSVLLPIAPAPRSEIGQACFVNRGHSTVLLTGTSEPRSVSRSPMTIDGRSVAGDVALAFYDDRPRSLLSRVGDLFAHASTLTDRLVPVWLVWAIAIVVAFGVPIAAISALFLALREDKARATEL